MEVNLTLNKKLEDGDMIIYHNNKWCLVNKEVFLSKALKDLADLQERLSQAEKDIKVLKGED